MGSRCPLLPSTSSHCGTGAGGKEKAFSALISPRQGDVRGPLGLPAMIGEDEDAGDFQQEAIWSQPPNVGRTHILESRKKGGSRSRMRFQTVGPPVLGAPEPHGCLRTCKGPALITPVASCTHPSPAKVLGDAERTGQESLQPQQQRWLYFARPCLGLRDEQQPNLCHGWKNTDEHQGEKPPGARGPGSPQGPKELETRR